MLLENAPEKKNHGNATPLLQLPDDICGKLKGLDLNVSETSEGKFKASLKLNIFSEDKLKDNFSIMKDSKKNNFGDDINKIGDQLKNIQIVDKEYNFPSSKNAEIVLNILCDNKIQENENYMKDSNRNVEEQPLSNEKMILKESVSKEEKVCGKLKSDSSSLKHNEVQKEVDETTVKVCNVSDVSKKNVETLCARAPEFPTKNSQRAQQRYNACSRSHHSGGKLRVQEPSQPTLPTMNGYQSWSVNSQLNIPNEQQQFASPVQTSFLQVIEGQTANMNINSQCTAPGMSLEEDDDYSGLFQKLLQEHPDLVHCDLFSSNTYMGTMAGGDINQNRDEILLPSSPEDSGTSSLGSPGGNYQPPSVGPDSGLDSPSHGPEFSYETLYDLDKTECKNKYNSHVSDYQKGHVAQECPEAWADMQSGQIMPQRPFPQGIQQRSFSQGSDFVHENQKKQFVQGQQFFQNQNIQGPQILQNQNIQGPHILQNQNIQGPQILQNQNIQGPQILQNQNIQGPQILQTQNIQGPQILQAQNIQGPQILQAQNIQGPQILQAQNIQGPQILQTQNIQGPQILQTQNIQGPQILQNQNIQGPQILQNQIMQGGNIQEKTNISGGSIVLEKTPYKQVIQEKNTGLMIQMRPPCVQVKDKRSDVQGGKVLDASYPACRDMPQTCRLSESPTRGQRTRYIPIAPKPESSAKARFQQILDKEQKFLAWVKIHETLIADPNKLETQDAEGDTDLMIACCNKFPCHLEMIYAMVENLRKKANSLTIRNKQGHSALYLACKVLYDVPEVAAYIAEALSEQKVEVSKMTYDGGLTLIQILEKKGATHKKVLEELLALKDSSGKNVFQSGNDVNG